MPLQKEQDHWRKKEERIIDGGTTKLKSLPLLLYLLNNLSMRLKESIVCTFPESIVLSSASKPTPRVLHKNTIKFLLKKDFSK